MADHTHIEWTDATWNPITGCSVVSAGCKHCYAMKLAGTRMRHHQSRAGLTIATQAGPVWTGEVRFNEEWLDQPLRWTRPRRIFVCAHGDLFHENVPDEWIDDVFEIMARAPQHQFQVLTKRPERMARYFAGMAESELRDRVKYDALAETLQWPLPNVWLGVSIEDQKTADMRVLQLLRTPAAVRWVSAEPLLGPIRLWKLGVLDYEEDSLGAEVYALSGTRAIPDCDWKVPARIDWVVVGGESGGGARPMHPEWARSLRDQCADAGVAFLFKQWGDWAPRSACYHRFADGTCLADLDPLAEQWPCARLTEQGNDGRELVHADQGDHAYMQRCGKKIAGRMLDGKVHDGYPSEVGRNG